MSNYLEINIFFLGAKHQNSSHFEFCCRSFGNSLLLVDSRARFWFKSFRFALVTLHRD